jgi:hypothetical protein
MKNKALAIEAIKNDCELQGRYWCDGKTCAVGKLAQLAGITDNELRLMGTACINANSQFHDAQKGRLVLKTTDAIWEKFGLSVRDLVEIQEANDHSRYYDLGIRRSEVAKVLEKFTDEA